MQKAPMKRGTAAGDGSPDAAISSVSFGVANVIESIATDRLGAQLLSLLHEMSGVDHCTIFKFRGDQVSSLASASLDGTDTAARQTMLYVNGQHWREDPMIMQAKHRSAGPGVALIHTSISSLPAGKLRDVIYGRTGIRERVMICGTCAGETIGISALHSNHQGSFSERQIARLRELSSVLIASLAKHAEIMQKSSLQHVDLNSLPAIVEKLSSVSNLFSKRELEVCARILYGLSTIGIALDLGIGEESVVTYRKRAFFRLNIATRRELLLWYLNL